MLKSNLRLIENKSSNQFATNSFDELKDTIKSQSTIILLQRRKAMKVIYNINSKLPTNSEIFLIRTETKVEGMEYLKRKQILFYGYFTNFRASIVKTN